MQVSVTYPENEKRRHGFLSVAQYPRGFEADDGEFGMIIEGGTVKERLFSQC